MIIKRILLLVLIFLSIVLIGEGIYLLMIPPTVIPTTDVVKPTSSLSPSVSSPKNHLLFQIEPSMIVITGLVEKIDDKTITVFKDGARGVYNLSTETKVYLISKEGIPSEISPAEIKLAQPVEITIRRDLTKDPPLYFLDRVNVFEISKN
jgi:hypothetical protein